MAAGPSDGGPGLPFVQRGCFQSLKPNISFFLSYLNCLRVISSYSGQTVIDMAPHRPTYTRTQLKDFLEIPESFTGLSPQQAHAAFAVAVNHMLDAEAELARTRRGETRIKMRLKELLTGGIVRVVRRVAGETKLYFGVAGRPFNVMTVSASGQSIHTRDANDPISPLRHYSASQALSEGALSGERYR